jgi:hypothetical protein
LNPDEVRLIRTVPLADITPGMVLARPVTNFGGAVLIPEGAPIAEKHMDILKKWGITEIFIQVGDGDASSLPELSESDLEAVKADLEQRFLEGHEGEVMETIWQFCLQRAVVTEREKHLES